MHAMMYEYLLRRAWQTGREKTNGADADIYRNMEYAYRNLETKNMFANQEERVYDFQKKFAQVREYLKSALRAGIDKIRYNLDAKDIAELDKMQNSLDNRFYDKESLDLIIEEAGNIFKKYGLEV